MTRDGILYGVIVITQQFLMKHSLFYASDLVQAPYTNTELPSLFIWQEET